MLDVDIGDDTETDNKLLIFLMVPILNNYCYRYMLVILDIDIDTNTDTYT